jgi:hypothetical protein
MRAEITSGGQVVRVIRQDGKWHHSTFPHPLVTFDYDENATLIAVVVIGGTEERVPTPPRPMVIKTLLNALSAAESADVMRGGGRDYATEDAQAAARKWLEEMAS